MPKTRSVMPMRLSQFAPTCCSRDFRGEQRCVMGGAGCGEADGSTGQSSHVQIPELLLYWQRSVAMPVALLSMPQVLEHGMQVLECGLYFCTERSCAGCCAALAERSRVRAMSPAGLRSAVQCLDALL